MAGENERKEWNNKAKQLPLTNNVMISLKTLYTISILIFSSLDYVHIYNSIICCWENLAFIRT